jgi:hypothetical protein
MEMKQWSKQHIEDWKITKRKGVNGAVEHSHKGKCRDNRIKCRDGKCRVTHKRY